MLLYLVVNRNHLRINHRISVQYYNFLGYFVTKCEVVRDVGNRKRTLLRISSYLRMERCHNRPQIH